MTQAEPAVDPLRPGLAALLPTADDVAFYRAHGWWVSGPILPADVVDAAEAGMARFYAGTADRPLPDGSARRGWTAADGDVLRKNDYASLVTDGLAALVRHPLIAACAARLCGAAEIRLWHDQLLYKPAVPPGPPGPDARPANVGWHTDRQYWRCCSSDRMLTAWVPFHEVRHEHGPVSFVDGSHAWPEDVVLDFFDPDLSRLDAVRRGHTVRLVEALIPRGGFSVHHCRTIHGSGPNVSGEPRRSIAVHLQPGENRHVEPPIGPAGTRAHHPNDALCRRGPDGEPDYADPAVCPRLYPPA